MAYGSIKADSLIRDNSGSDATIALSDLAELRNIPQNSKSSAYTLIASDNSKHILTTANVTVPNGVFSAGHCISIINNSGSAISIVQGSSFTLYNAADGGTGNKSAAARSMSTILFTASNVGYITGAGIS